MVGNDIIDIAATLHSKDTKGLGWKRPAFVEKIFTESEQKLIADSKDPFITVWQLWSMKESAYKVFIQAGGKPFYNPKKLECRLDESNGHVQIEKLNLKCKSIINEKYIYTVATKEIYAIKSKVLKIGNDVKLQSENLKKQLLEDYSQEHNLAIERLKVEKIQNGIPRLFYEGKDLGRSLSLTHCGKFGAYSLLSLKKQS